MAALTTASVAEQVMNIVREAIITGTLPTDVVYSVDRVARELHLEVSRTPVREALVRLADDGLVQFERNRGVRILTPTVHDLEEIFQLRLMVEVPAAYQAARHADAILIYGLQRELGAMAGAADAYTMLLGQHDDDPAIRDSQLSRLNREFIAHDSGFHELVIGASGNRRLVETVRRWRNSIASIAQWRGFADAKDVHAEHEEILDALKIQDASGAASTMREHITKAGNTLLDRLKESQGAGEFDPHWADGVAIPGKPPTS
jgi:DNA-binding GntR family transcriptional regulator